MKDSVSLAPIALFVYNRNLQTEKAVAALQQNKLAKESDLFVFSDGFKDENGKSKVQEVRRYLKTITGFKSITIIEREKNMGLANSIIAGVTEIVNRYGKIIVVEDDLVTAPYFLSYMNQALLIYQDEEKVISIHGYVYPVEEKLPETFFIKGADCWGWATWARGWKLFQSDGVKLLEKLQKQKLEKEFNFNNSFDYVKMLKDQIEGRNNSWAVRWYASAFLENKLTLYPRKSLVNNIGFDGSGTHSKSGGQKIFDTMLEKSEVKLKPVAVEESDVGRKAFIRYFRKNKTGVGGRLKQIIYSAKNKLRDKLKKSMRLRAFVIQSRVLLNHGLGLKDEPLNKKKPWIVKAATEWLNKCLTKEMIVFEWGGGGSTLFLAERVKEIISIEHNYEWFLKLKMYIRFNHISNCKYKLIQPESGKSLEYASTDENYLNYNFEKYVKTIDSFPDNYFDLAFIDGRARASCLRHAKNKIKIGGFILLDNSERQEYQSAINLLQNFKRTDFWQNGSSTSIFQRLVQTE